MTYEAALARIFKDGRTETIRSCSPAATVFVKEMMDKTSDKGVCDINNVLYSCIIFMCYIHVLNSFRATKKGVDDSGTGTRRTD